MTPSRAPDSLQPHGLQPAGLLYPWDSPSQNTGVGCHSLLQGIFPTQGPNPHLLHWQTGSSPRSPLGSPSLHQHVCLVSVHHLHLSLAPVNHLSVRVHTCTYVSSPCLFSSCHLCVNKSMYLSLVSSAHLSFIHRHVCCLSINPSMYRPFIHHLSVCPGEGNGDPLQ